MSDTIEARLEALTKIVEELHKTVGKLARAITETRPNEQRRQAQAAERDANQGEMELRRLARDGRQ